MIALGRPTAYSQGGQRIGELVRIDLAPALYRRSMLIRDTGLPPLAPGARTSGGQPADCMGWRVGLDVPGDYLGVAPIVAERWGAAEHQPESDGAEIRISRMRAAFVPATLAE